MPTPRWVTYQTRLHLSRFSPLHNGRTMVAQWPSFWRRDAGLSTPPSAQRGDANGPSVPRSGLAWHCAIGDARHWPDSRLAIVSFRAFCRKLGIWWGCALNVIPAAGRSHRGGRRLDEPGASTEVGSVDLRVRDIRTPAGGRVAARTLMDADAGCWMLDGCSMQVMTLLRIPSQLSECAGLDRPVCGDSTAPTPP